MNEARAMPGTPGAPSDITTRQREKEHLRRLVAYARHYDLAQRWRVARMLSTLILAGVAPFIAYFYPVTSGLLAAVAAGWLVIGRTVLSHFEDKHTGTAVSIQELYDTMLFRLPWNSSLCGAKPSEVDIAAAANKKRRGREFDGDWYTLDLSKAHWPGDVVLCQRQSASWSSSIQDKYADFVAILASAWFLGGVVFALGTSLSVGDYLVRLFLPCAPAFVDAVGLFREHKASAARRGALATEIEGQWEAYCRDQESLTITVCRQNQDVSYLTRRSSPRVPKFFYELLRSSMDVATRQGTEPMINAETRQP
jgi:hypothetical protein